MAAASRRCALPSQAQFFNDTSLPMRKHLPPVRFTWSSRGCTLSRRHAQWHARQPIVWPHPAPPLLEAPKSTRASRWLARSTPESHGRARPPRLMPAPLHVSSMRPSPAAAPLAGQAPGPASRAAASSPGLLPAAGPPPAAHAASPRPAASAPGSAGAPPASSARPRAAPELLWCAGPGGCGCRATPDSSAPPSSWPPSSLPSSSLNPLPLLLGGSMRLRSARQVTRARRPCAWPARPGGAGAGAAPGWAQPCRRELAP